MIYKNIVKAEFIKRPNRFIAHVLVNGVQEIVHVKNTGRCREILKEGTTVILEESNNFKRKTRYSLISAYKGSMLINIDSQSPNTVVYEAIRSGKIIGFQGITNLKREITYGNSRFDMYFETPSEKGFIEVKGATLEKDGVAMFPDAPTQRGTKHIYELMKALKDGYKTYVIFLIQMKGINLFTANAATDSEFSSVLKAAKKAGVDILAYNSVVREDSITIGERIVVKL